MRGILRRWRCRRIAARLVDFAEGCETVPGETLRSHLEGCPDCSETVRALREIPAQLKLETGPEPPDSWECQQQDIMRAVRQVAPAQRSPAGGVRKWLPLPAAAVVLLSFFVWTQSGDRVERQARTVERQATVLSDDPLELAALADLVSADDVAWETLDEGGVVGTDVVADPWLPTGEYPEPPDFEDLEEEELDALVEMTGAWSLS